MRRVPYGSVIDLIVIFLFVYAFLIAEARARIIMTTILVLFFVLPALFKIAAIYWICYVGKVIFGLSCYVYTRAKKAGL
jgi:prepilin signal peptidase PulO-like enzyme (type II secretory pathway)